MVDEQRMKFTYDEWIESLGLPVERSFFVQDVRTIELGHWAERGCDTAFIQLMGQEGISEARVTEIGPGERLDSYKLAVDEVVYVAAGRGLTTVWHGDDREQTFEWQDHALFMIPRHMRRQFRSMQGDKATRLVHYNYLPLAMSMVPEAEFFLHNSFEPRDSDAGNPFAEARVVPDGVGRRWVSAGSKKAAYWYGNFFPDMRVWDRLDTNARRGAGGKTVRIQFAESDMSCHMSMFPARTYKKAHRHGPGRVILIPGGEGYSVMWREGEEKTVIPWQEGSLFVPPGGWFHQHFNLGESPARYLALHPPMQFHGYAEKIEDRQKDQIEYPDEDLWIREYFERELGRRNLSSLMPARAYEDRGYEWTAGA